MQPVPVTFQTLPGRITARHLTYHHVPGSQPTMVDSTWERTLTTRGRPVVTDLEVGGDWIRHDCSRASLVTVANQHRPRATIPTPEERAEADAAVVELSFSTPPSAHALVPVGEGDSFTPAVPEFWLRCRRRTAAVLITELPK